MRKLQVLFVLALLALGSWLSVQGQEADEEKTVTISAKDEAIASVAEEVEKQTGIQVAVTEWTEGTVSGEVEDVGVEEAVRMLAEGAVASWIRAYIIEAGPPDEPYTAAELLAMLQEARTAVFEGLTDEESQELMTAWRERLAPEEAADQPEGEGRGMRGGAGMRGFGMFGPDAGGPGGGVASMRGPEGEAAPGGEGGPEGRGGPGGRADFMAYEDPIRRLLLPARSDTVSLDLAGVSVQDAISAFTAGSCFLVVADEDLAGEVTVQLEKAPLSEVLDAIAGAAEAEWRTVYLVSQPRELTDAEVAERQTQMEQRREQRFQQMWGRFWERSPEERADFIQRHVGYIENRLANASPERLERMKRRSARMLSRLTQYSATLSPEQRMEIKPFLQAIAKRMQ